MLEKKLEYSNMMSSQSEDEKKSMWGEKAYLYKRKYYIDEDDKKAFKDEKEANEAIEREINNFLKENNLFANKEN